MSALVRFLATKPRRVYLFPVVIEYKKILTKKRAPITLYFLHQWSFYISYHIFRKFSNTKRKEYLRYYYYHFLQGVPFHEKKSFLFLLMRFRMGKKNQWKICEIFPWILHTKLTVVVPLSHAWTNEDYRQTDLCYIWILGTS